MTRIITISTALSLLASGCAGDATRLGASTAGPAIVSDVATPTPSASVTTGPRRILLADLVGTTGPRGIPPAAGEITCRGRGIVTIDMTQRPPFGRVSARFEIDMTSCPDGTVVTEIHVHDNVAGHSEQVHMGAAVVRSQALIGGAGLVVTSNDGIDPKIVDTIFADPDRYILALHTERNPVGGAGRGVLRRG